MYIREIIYELPHQQTIELPFNLLLLFLMSILTVNFNFQHYPAAGVSELIIIQILLNQYLTPPKLVVGANRALALQSKNETFPPRFRNPNNKLSELSACWDWEPLTAYGYGLQFSCHQPPASSLQHGNTHNNNKNKCKNRRKHEHGKIKHR